MNIQLVSDLHLDFGELEWGYTEADVVVLAGDIHAKDKALAWIEKTFSKDTPVVYILGNHEYYGHSYPNLLNVLKGHSLPNLHVLENDTFTLNGYTFIGATLWTDFKLCDDPFAMVNATSVMSDYRYIRMAPNYSKITAQQILRIHEQSRKYISKQIEACDALKTVVVTHHLPSPLSIHDSYKGEKSNAYYASDLSDLIRQYQPRLWLHGHSHKSANYWMEKTQVVSNPYGYRGENSEFQKNLVLEI
jgi:Icc-related predicted phosphoesterase